MTTLREAAEAVMEQLKGTWVSESDPVAQDLKAALEEPEQEPVAWMHNNIRDNIISHPPADLKRHPERWTALYSEPKPCPTCVALSRAVMMDQTAHDAPPQRKPLTDDEIVRWVASGEYNVITNDWASHIDFARAIEQAHGIKENP